MQKVSRILLLTLLATLMGGLMLVTTEATTFTDIQGHWAQSTIESLADKGIIKGYPDGSFKPEQAVTRAEFATLLVNAMEIPLLNPSRATFPDVPQGMWCYRQVETAAARQLVVGWDGRFYPHYGITHEQAAVMLVNALGRAGEAEQLKQGSSSFTDDQKISPWARGSVVLAARLGILAAYLDGSLRPQVVTTRAEMAVFLFRFFSQYRRPAAAPTLLSASYDSRNDLLTLTFDRMLSPASTDVTRIGIQFNDEQQVYFLDTRSRVRTTANSSELEIAVVGLPEPNRVQKASVTLQAGAVRDVTGVSNEATTHFLQYVSHVDTTRPELQRVSYDRGDRELTLEFSEPVLKSSLDLERFQAYRLDRDEAVWLVLQDLEGGRILTPAGEYGDRVTIELTSGDAYNLAYYLDRGEVYLTCSGVKDRNGNAMASLDPARKEGVLIRDGEAYTGELALQSGSYDADGNRLTLNFNRAVDPDTVRLERIALKFNSSDNPFRDLDSDYCRVLNSSVSSRIIIEVDEDLVREPGEVDRAWVRLEDNAVRDTYGDGNSEVIRSLAVDDSGGDLPNLKERGARYNPDDNLLLLSFEKRIKTADLTEIKLWTKESNGTAKWVIPLDRSIYWSFNSGRDELQCRLTDGDAWWVEHERQVWLRVEAGAAVDYDGNQSRQQDVELEFRGYSSSPVNLEEAVIKQDGYYWTADTEWGKGDTITLTFSDPVQVSGLHLSDFRLASGGESLSPGRGAEITKTGDDTITIYLGDGCGITPARLYQGVEVSYIGDSLYDLAGRPVGTLTCRITGADSSSPEAERISFKDLNSNQSIDKNDQITLTFQEPVWVAGTAAGEVTVTGEEGSVQGSITSDPAGAEKVEITVTDGTLKPSGWWSDDLEVRFDQEPGNKVIIDCYGNPTPRVQRFGYWW